MALDESVHGNDMIPLSSFARGTTALIAKRATVPHTGGWESLFATSPFAFDDDDDDDDDDANMVDVLLIIMKTWFQRKRWNGHRQVTTTRWPSGD